MTDDPLKSVVFYSWQSDSSPATNRDFIREALESAAKTASGERTVVIDSDTAGLTGAPDIAPAVFEKIGHADAFVADVSFVTSYERESDGSRRFAPNTNVAMELQHAVSHLGHLSWERVILVFNDASGDPSMLPFNLAGKHVIRYSADAREELERKLAEQLRGILANPRSGRDPVIEAIADGARRRVSLLDRALGEIGVTLDQYAPDPASDENAALAAMNRTIELVERITRWCVAAATAEDTVVLDRIYAWALRDVAGVYAFSSGTDAHLDYYRFLTHEIVVTVIATPLARRQWEVVDALLAHREEPRVKVRDRLQQKQIYDFRVAGALAGAFAGPANQRSKLLKARHDNPPLSDLLSLRDFAAADFLMFLRQGFDDSSSEFHFTPWSAVYVGGPPSFLVRSESRAVADRVVRLLLAKDVGDLKKRVHGIAREAQRYFDGGHKWGPLVDFDVEAIGSLP